MSPAPKARIPQNDIDTKYLLYLPSTRHQDTEYWLLDLLMQGYQYMPDRNTLLLNECGLSNKFRNVMEGHVTFLETSNVLSYWANGYEC